jgi:hypothetical protein
MSVLSLNLVFLIYNKQTISFSVIRHEKQSYTTKKVKGSHHTMFSSQIKVRVVLTLVKATSLRIMINLDEVSITPTKRSRITINLFGLLDLMINPFDNQTES